MTRSRERGLGLSVVVAVMMTIAQPPARAVDGCSQHPTFGNISGSRDTLCCQGRKLPIAVLAITPYPCPKVRRHTTQSKLFVRPIEFKQPREYALRLPVQHLSSLFGPSIFLMAK